MRGGSNRLMSMAEAAETLGVSRDWLYRNYRAIGLKVKDLAPPGSQRRSLRVSERDLETWVERNNAT